MAKKVGATPKKCYSQLPNQPESICIDNSGAAVRPAKPSRKSAARGSMQRLEQKGWFSGPQDGVTYTRATSLDDLMAAYALVHDAYVEAGYMSPQPSGLRIRPFDAISDTATFVAKAAERVVGVCSLVLDSDDLGLPSDKVFGPEIGALRHRGQRLCEGSNWAISPDYRRTNVSIELLRCCMTYALAKHCDELLAAISPGHLPFYQLLTFETIGAERNYSSEVHDPVVLVKIRLEGFEERFASDEGEKGVLRRYCLTENPYHSTVPAWVRTAKNHFRDTDFLKQLAVERSNLLHRCATSDLAAIRRNWGEEAFRQVADHSTLWASGDQ